MKFFLPEVIVMILLACSGNGCDRIVTTVSLMNVMTDLQRLTSLPVDNNRTIQFSSYDRRSTKHSDSRCSSNKDGFGNEPVQATLVNHFSGQVSLKKALMK